MTELPREWYERYYQGNDDAHLHYTHTVYFNLWAHAIAMINRFNLSRRHDIPCILELGCGSGQFSQMLFDSGFKSYLGIDFALPLPGLSCAGQLHPEYIKNFLAWLSCSAGEMRKHDIYDWDTWVHFPYEMVVCMETLEHLERDIEVIARVRPETFMVFSVPDFPFESHVRYFLDETDVHDRYREYFFTLGVQRIGHYFLACGERK